MSRGLFIYWKLPRGRLAPARDAVQAFQAAWRDMGVQAELHERDDETGEIATLMETYARDGGLPPELEAALLSGSAATLGHWAEGSRHVEVFRRCPR